MATVEQAAAELQPLLRGTYVDPSAPEYDEARALYNAMIDKRPAGIVRCADVADVIAAVRHAREHEMRVAVRSGGHNGGGSAAWTEDWSSTSPRCAE
jgi:FAD/FMN-containing dehydrogenase